MIRVFRSSASKGEREGERKKDEMKCFAEIRKTEKKKKKNWKIRTREGSDTIGTSGGRGRERDGWM